MKTLGTRFLALLLGAALVVLGPPVAADHLNDSPSYYFPDVRGEAAVQADLTGGTFSHVVEVPGAVEMTAFVRDVRGSGRYEAHLIHSRPHFTPIYVIATVVKDPGRAPRATFVWKRGADGAWRSDACPVRSTWDEGRNRVSLRVAISDCLELEQESYWNPSALKVRYSSQGAVDQADARLFPPTFDRYYYDAAGDSAVRSDIRTARHVKAAGHVSLPVYVADLPDHGRYVVETSFDSRHTRIVVTKAAGQPPVATIAVGPYSWRRVACRPVVNWDAAGNKVMVHVYASTAYGAECPAAYDYSQEPFHYGFVDVGGSTDVIR